MNQLMIDTNILHNRIDKQLAKLVEQGYTEEQVEDFFHNILNAWSKRAADEKIRNLQDLTGRKLYKRRAFTVVEDHGSYVIGRWSDEHATKRVQKTLITKMLEERVVWWE